MKINGLAYKLSSQSRDKLSIINQEISYQLVYQLSFNCV